MINKIKFKSIVKLFSLIGTAAIFAFVLYPAAAAQSEDAQTLVSRASALLDDFTGQRAQLSEAHSMLTRAVALDPNIPEAYLEQARYEMKSAGLGAEALERAEALLRKSLEIDPKFGNGYVLLGYVYTHQQRFRDASEAFDQAKRLAATSPWLDFNIGEMLYVQGDVPSAELKFVKVADATHFPPQVRTTALEKLAKLYLEQRKREAAKQAYLRATELAPDNPWLAVNLSNVLRVEMLEVDDAVHWARRALSIMNFGAARKSLALSLYLKWAEALITERNPGKADLYFTEARELHSEAGDTLYEVPRFPRPHPIIEALRSIGYSVSTYPGIRGGTTPLIAAVARDNRDIIKQLIQFGANVNEAGYGGKAALTIAALNNNFSIVQLLLSAGADPKQMDSSGKDTLFYAESKGYSDIVSVLKKHIGITSETSQSAGASGSETPFRVGYIYRVKMDIIASNGWGTGFRSGDELVFMGYGMYTDKSILRCDFRDLKSPNLFIRDWGVKKSEIHNWSVYFEEIGPFSSD
ncbi:MAG TPA: ankyrin repeat domain-containing protein [Gammaproteobacteria bacterium]